MAAIFNQNAREFLDRAGWGKATGEPISGDASARRYFRLCRDNQTAILMDACRNPEIVPPFIQIDLHLQQLGFSVPAILSRNDKNGLLLLEDFGDASFARLLDGQPDAISLTSGEPGSPVPDACQPADGGAHGVTRPTTAEQLYALATDLLIALHHHPRAIPTGLRAYHPEQMVVDIELFLEWCTPSITPAGRNEFRKVWREVLPIAHEVPASLLLRDYHVANLMFLPQREGIRQAGLLDFQDAYQGPITYDLVSLLEDARRDVPDDLRGKMLTRYLSRSPALDRQAFATSLAILTALRHTRVLAVFERMSRQEGKSDYKRLHSPRVKGLLQRALAHPRLDGIKQWMGRYAG